jgi:hypothetical protein
MMKLRTVYRLAVLVLVVAGWLAYGQYFSNYLNLVLGALSDLQQ